MRIVRKLRDTSKWIDNVLEEEVRPKPAPKPKPPKDSRKSKLQGLGERLGFAGIALVTAAAVLAGCAGCKPTEAPSRPTPTAHCEEDQPCWDCTRMGNHKCDPNGRDL
jgi:hypothetical protein